MGYGLNQAGSGWGQLAGVFECDNELPGSKKCWEFLEWLRNGQLLKKDSAPWSQLVV